MGLGRHRFMRILHCQLLLICCAGYQAFAAESASPLKAAEYLQAQVPQGWSLHRDIQTGLLRTREYYPSDDVGAWEQRLKIESLSGQDLPDPLVVMAGLAGERAQRCDSFKRSTLFAGIERGYPTVVDTLTCSRHTRSGRPMLSMIKIIQGKHALHTLSRTWRLPPIDQPTRESPDFNRLQVASWANALSKVYVCNPRIPESGCALDPAVRTTPQAVP